MDILRSRCDAAVSLLHPAPPARLPMTILLLPLIAALALAGWGRITTRLLRHPGAGPLTPALGLAGVILLGGVLSALGLAGPLSFDLVLAVGVLTGAASLARLRGTPGAGAWTLAAPLLVLLAAGGWVWLHLTTWQAYNLHDDFERYFAYPQRLLQTGTLRGNAAGYLGFDTLGAPAYLQAFVLRHLPAWHLGVIESGVGLTLCLFLLLPTRPGTAAALLAAAAQVILLLVNPQVVNIAPLFTTAALVLAASLAGRDLLAPARPRGSLPALALLYAALLALKPTNGLFVATHAAALTAAAAAGRRAWRQPLLDLGALTLATTAFTAPWLAVHASTYLAAWRAPRLRAPQGTVTEIPALWSTFVPQYGSAQLAYTLAAAAACVLPVVAWAAARRVDRRDSAALGAGLAAGTAGLACYLILVGLIVENIGRDACTRYATPMLLGTLPAALVLAGAAAPPRRNTLGAWTILAGGLAAIGLLFLPAAATRVRQVAARGSPLAYLGDDRAGHVKYTREVLGPDTRTAHERLQAMVPPGETIIAWTSAPFWFDFRRNPIHHTDPYGLSMPREGLPAARYLIWQYAGFGFRPKANLTAGLRAPAAIDRLASARALGFIDLMEKFSRDGRILHDDGQRRLIRIGD